MNEAAPIAPRVSLEKPLTIAILAMGGQGGGVLADWIVEVAEHEGWAAQSTSVPGVAQRTGATIYYIETLPPRNGVAPVFSLMPTPGDVDVVMAAGATRPSDRSCEDRRRRKNNAHRLDASGLCGGREGEAGRWRRRSVRGRRCARLRRSADHRLRYGEARGRTRHGDLGRDARRARGFGRATVRAAGLRRHCAQRRARRQCEPRRVRRRL